MKRIQQNVDYLNNLMDGDLKFIKERLFPDVWKFGFAYSSNEDSEALGFFKIRIFESGSFIQAFDFDKSIFSKNSYERISFYNKKLTKRDNIEHFAKSFLQNVISFYFKNHLLEPKIMPDIILNEIAFDFLDKISLSCARLRSPIEPHPYYYQDSEQTDIFGNYINYMIRVINHEISKIEEVILKKQPHKNPSAITYQINPFDYLKRNEQFFYEMVDNKLQLDDIQLIREIEIKFDFNLVLKVKEELTERNIKYISHLYKKMNFEKCLNDLKEVSRFQRRETGYSINDFYYNFEIVLRNIKESYEYTSKKLFGSNYLNYMPNIEFCFKLMNDFSYSYESNKKEHNSFNILINPEEFINFEQAHELYIKGQITNFSVGSGKILSKYVENKPLYNIISETLSYYIHKRYNLNMDTTERSILLKS